jgi:hypothetical protein
MQRNRDTFTHGTSTDDSNPFTCQVADDVGNHLYSCVTD